MLDDPSRQNVLVPLVLRLALAAVFIYHGLDKVAGQGNNWGAEWAFNLWAHQGLPPDDVLAKVDALGRESEQRKVQIKDELREAYQQDQRAAPESLQFVGSQMAVAWGELICGVTLLLGLLTRLSALAMIVIQVGAIATVTWAKGFSPAQGVGYEYNLVVIAACAALALTGGGLLAADRCVKSWRARRAATATAPAARTPAGV
jgi:uncharacterized membrane protein YphA (DoxX/SURF4 family)